MINLLPNVGTKAFRGLHFKEQLFILNLFLYEREKYNVLTDSEEADTSLFYLEDGLSFLLDKQNIGTPTFEDDALPLSFIEDFWAAYLSHYDSKWYEDFLSPIDLLGLQHKRIIGLNFFTFPFLCCDPTSYLILKWLRSERISIVQDLLFYLIRMRVAAEYFVDNGDARIKYYAKQKTSKKYMHPPIVDGIPVRPLSPDELHYIADQELGDYSTISSLNEDFPILEDSGLSSMLEEDVYVLLPMHIRFASGRFMVPLVPSELYLKRFYIKTWDFLVTRS